MQELMIPVLLLCNYNNTMHRLIPKSRTLGPGWIELVTDSRIHVFSVTVANLHRTNECLFQTLPHFLSRVPHTVEKHPSLHNFAHYFHKYRHSALIQMAKSAMFRFVLFLEYSGRKVPISCTQSCRKSDSLQNLKSYPFPFSLWCEEWHQTYWWSSTPCGYILLNHYNTRYTDVCWTPVCRDAVRHHWSTPPRISEN